MSKVLLTPGPCMTSESVRAAAAAPDLNHRDPEYLSLIRETKDRLLGIYDQTSTGWQPYFLGGSGTLAVEAMITSCVREGPVLVLENGYYSGRLREILQIHGIPFHALEHDWLESWNFERIAVELRQGYEAVLGTHNETTTGRLNDIARLGRLSKEYGSTCLVDAMSSFGADPIDFTNLDAVCASANKCLHGIPGVGFVLVNSRIIPLMEDVPRRSYYMSLPMYQGDHPPLTPPVPALSAFRQALREVPIGGAVERERDYRSKADYLRTELTRRGFSSPIPFSETSSTLTTFTLPNGFAFEAWFEANAQVGFILYGCKGGLRDKYFQVSNMGDLTMNQLKHWIAAVDRLLK